MTSPPQSIAVPASAVLTTWAAHDWGNGLRLDDLSPLDRITVTTHHSTYEIVVLSPATADVLVRGGAFFPAFTPARLAGCSLGGSFLKLRAVHVGFRLEVAHEGRVVITSAIGSIGVTPGPSADQSVM